MENYKLAPTVKGHEIWLGNANVEDNEVEIALSYGHNMKRDGTVASENVTPLVYTPACTTLAPSVTPQ